MTGKSDDDAEINLVLQKELLDREPCLERRGCVFGVRLRCRRLAGAQVGSVPKAGRGNV